VIDMERNDRSTWAETSDRHQRNPQPSTAPFGESVFSMHWFADLAEAQRVLAAWQEDYNNHRPHTSVRQQTPSEFTKAGSFHPRSLYARISHLGWTKFEERRQRRAATEFDIQGGPNRGRGAAECGLNHCASLDRCVGVRQTSERLREH
jgi:Integrase core domain